MKSVSGQLTCIMKDRLLIQLSMSSQTRSSQTVTRTIESDFEPNLIYLKLTDVSLLPQWAPVFADRVEHAQETTFRVTKGNDAFDLELFANESTLTVDYLRKMAGGRRGGAYIRVMPKPLGGSVVAMTVPVGPNATSAQVATVLEQELEALVKLL
jgi:hypothetical protein